MKFEIILPDYLYFNRNNSTWFLELFTFSHFFPIACANPKSKFFRDKDSTELKFLICILTHTELRYHFRISYLPIQKRTIKCDHQIKKDFLQRFIFMSQLWVCEKNLKKKIQKILWIICQKNVCFFSVP